MNNLYVLTGSIRSFINYIFPNSPEEKNSSLEDKENYSIKKTISGMNISTKNLILLLERGFVDKKNISEKDWEKISRYEDLTENFIRKFSDELIWGIFPWKVKDNLSDKFIREFKHKIVWDSFGCFRDFDEDFLWEVRDYVDWSWVFWNQTLSKNIIDKCLENKEIKNKVEWTPILLKKDLSKEEIKKYLNEVDWCFITKIFRGGEILTRINSSYMRSDILKDYPDKFDWHEISKEFCLDVEFVRKFKDKLDWDILSKRMDVRLDEKIYREFGNYFN